MRPELEKLLKQEWYTQGFAARPAFLVSACSIDVMYKGLGFSYETIFMNYKEDYCNFNYPSKGLSEHSEIILKKIQQNPKYLEEKRNQYEKEMTFFENNFKTARNAISNLSEKKLFLLLLRLELGMETSVGIAHLLESISLRLEHDLRSRLAKKTTGKELNEDFSTISSPVTQSFLSKKEEFLWQIKNAPLKEKKDLAEKFLNSFFWVNSSYSGSNAFSAENILKEADKINQLKKLDFNLLKEQKKLLIEKYGFSENEKKWVYWTEFLIDWQDSRKRHIFRAIFALDQAFLEISKRYGVELRLLHYLLPREIYKEIKNRTLMETAKRRIKGCVFIKQLGGTSIFDGSDFTEFEKAIMKKHGEVEILTGSSASLGTATGAVKICTTLDSLGRVRKGDVLVASMTRPEYIPAMKKAVAIITDEGGITSHAAIVSRELGIPCIIGTKNATKVLKDGWIVQVKANHGQVVVLEKR